MNLCHSIVCCQIPPRFRKSSIPMASKISWGRKCKSLAVHSGYDRLIGTLWSQRQSYNYSNVNSGCSDGSHVIILRSPGTG